ncbi:MAG: diguanylate cyclase and serine/threonine protein kinase with repeat, partial [Acidimicrobiales bacterium]|nr:diguanylate cyclase and serine/threonine protein kinase with repeat [Acidimicrobiales bacterium]
LVQADTNADGAIRYRLLETVREYSAAKLDDAGPDQAAATRTAHRDHFLALAEQAAPHLTSHDQLQWFDRLEAERDNLRATFAHCLADDDPEPGLRLARAMRYHWYIRADPHEAIDHLTTMLSRADTQAPTLSRGWALATLAQLRARDSELDLATVAEEVVGIGHEQGDHALGALGHWALSLKSFRRSEAERSVELARLGLELARQAGDDQLQAALTSSVARGLADQGRSAEAFLVHEEAHALATVAGDQILMNMVLANIGLSLLLSGDIDPARQRFQEAIEISRRVGDPDGVMGAMVNLALTEVVAADRHAARTILAEAIPLARRNGDIGNLAYLVLAAALAAAADDPVRAATLHGAADQTLADIDEAWELFEAGLRSADHERLRQSLGDVAFDEAYQAGRPLTLDAIIALALAGS